VKTGAGKLGEESLAATEICTVTLLAVPPVGQTRIWNWPACPGSTVPDVAVTLTHSCVTGDPGPPAAGVAEDDGLPGGDDAPAGSV
jgi:hypothetical protein